MKIKKLYFQSIDHTVCSSLESHFDDARDNELTKIKLIEAIPDKDNPNYIWCAHELEIESRQECKKAICPFYSSKSGRGVCEHRGILHQFGEEVEFDVPNI